MLQKVQHASSGGVLHGASPGWLNIVWARKVNHNKDSRHVSPITDSPTVYDQTCTDTWRHETTSGIEGTGNIIKSKKKSVPKRESLTSGRKKFGEYPVNRP